MHNSGVRRRVAVATAVAVLSTLLALAALAAPAGAEGVVTDADDVVTDGDGALWHAINPRRLADSRTGVGTPPGAWTAGETRDLTVAGVGTGRPTGGPADARAVAINLTATGASAASHLTAWPRGAEVPTASTVNFGPGATVANLAVVPIGVGGSLSIRNNRGTVHLVVDLVGWFAAAPGPDADPDPGLRSAALEPRSPVRVLDTRTCTDDTGGTTGAWHDDETRTVALGGGPAQVPAGAVAVVANVTVTGATAASHLTAWPADWPGDTPTLSTVNFGPGRTVANLAVLPLSAEGAVKLHNHAGDVHVVIDVVGWFA